MQNQVIYIIIFQVCAVISMYKTYDWKEKVMIKNILKHWFWMSWLSYWKPSLTVLLVLFKAKKTKLLRCYITYLTILFGNFTSSWDLLISLCLSNTTTEVYTPITKSCSDAAGISPSFFLFPLCIPGSLSLLACICLGAVPSSFLSGQSNSTPETHPLNRALQYLKPGTSHRLMPSCSVFLCGTKLLLSSFPRVIFDLRVILTSWSQVFFLYSVCQLTSRRALPSFPFSILSQ